MSVEQQRQHIERVKVQVAWAEGVIYVWRRVMWGISGLLALCALLSVLARVRPFQLAAAVVILLSTGVTLVGMWFLVHPERGAMPPLPVPSQALASPVFIWQPP